MSTNYSMEFPRISKQSINKETFERPNYNDYLAKIKVLKYQPYID